MRICDIFTNFTSCSYFNLELSFSKCFNKTLNFNNSVLNKAENKLVVLKLINKWACSKFNVKCVDILKIAADHFVVLKFEDLRDYGKYWCKRNNSKKLLSERNRCKISILLHNHLLSSLGGQCTKTQPTKHHNFNLFS